MRFSTVSWFITKFDFSLKFGVKTEGIWRVKFGFSYKVISTRDPETIRWWPKFDHQIDHFAPKVTIHTSSISFFIARLSLKFTWSFVMILGGSLESRLDGFLDGEWWMALWMVLWKVYAKPRRIISPLTSFVFLESLSIPSAKLAY